MNIGDSLERVQVEEERILLEEASIIGRQDTLNELQQKLDDNFYSGLWDGERVATEQAILDAGQARIDKRREVVYKDRESLTQRYQRLSKRGPDVNTLPRQPPAKKPRVEPIVPRDDGDASMDEEVLESEVKEKKRNPRFICM